MLTQYTDKKSSVYQISNYMINIMKFVTKCSESLPYIDSIQNFVFRQANILTISILTAMKIFLNNYVTTNMICNKYIKLLMVQAVNTIYPIIWLNSPYGTNVTLKYEIIV